MPCALKLPLVIGIPSIEMPLSSKRCISVSFKQAERSPLTLNWDSSK